MSKRKKNHPQQPIQVPIEVALMHLKPDELERLKRYVAAYVDKYGTGDPAPMPEGDGQA